MVRVDYRICIETAESLPLCVVSQTMTLCWVNSCQANGILSWCFEPSAQAFYIHWQKGEFMTLPIILGHKKDSFFQILST